jgi:hypothetical protein
MSREQRRNPAKECKCRTIRGFDLRDDRFPPGVMTAFEVIDALDGQWETLYRCSVCGEFWHRSHTGGHATVEIYNRVDQRTAAELIAAEAKARPLREAERERVSRENDAWLARNAKREKRSGPKIARGIALVTMVGGMLATMYAMTLDEGERQMRIVMIAGVTLLTGIAAAACAVWLERDTRN